MKVTVAVARVYATGDQYGDIPRTRPRGAPIRFLAFPDSRCNAVVDFGPVPSDIAAAEKGRRALGVVMLRALTGQLAADSPDEALNSVFAELSEESLFGNFSWYTSLVISRDLELADDQVAPTSFVIPVDLNQIAAEQISLAKPALDVLTTVAATIVDHQIFDRIVLDDRVLLFADGKRPSGVPVLSTPPVTLNLKHGSEGARLLSARLASFSVMDPRAASNERWLEMTAHWRVQGLVESDPVKLFLWSFFGLEILIHQLYERMVVDGNVRSLGDRFASVAQVMFPDSHADDDQRFREIKKARDLLSHGSLRDLSTLPGAQTAGLFAKYLDGATKRLLFGTSATDSWEANLSGPSDSSL